MITPDIVNFKKGITFYFLNDSKFKTASLKISFVRPLLKSEVTLNSLIPAIIRRGSEKHPDTKELNIYLDYLCGAEFTSGVRKKGENQLITFSYKTVSDKFFKEEKPFLQLIDLMEETLFNPLVADNGFKKEYVDREKENLDQMIKSVVNDKREYAKKRLIESMYDNCPYGLFEYGYSDDLKNINETNLFKHYLKVISESEIKVFVSGNFDKNEVLQKLTEIFGNKEVTPICVTFPEKDSYKEKYDIITEEDDVTQGKLVIGFKTNVTTDSSLYFPMLVANNLFGGSVHSKLFTVVREKMSLAYYAGSSFSAFKGFIMANCGIETNNFDITLKEVINQLDQMKKGYFTEEELSFSILSLSSSYKSVTDSMASMEDFYVAQTLLPKGYTLEECIEGISKVTKEDVVKASNEIVPDTVFFLKGGEEKWIIR